jgi:hypothetical protein
MACFTRFQAEQPDMGRQRTSKAFLLLNTAAISLASD